MSKDTNIKINNKKRKIVNEICGGITNPSSCHLGVGMIGGELYFKCPSRDGSEYHIVTIINNYDNTKFVCDCAGGFNDKPSEYCIHIRSILIYLCRQYIGNACEFISEKDDHIKFKHFIDSLARDTEKIAI
jgi:hypothetical protein